VSPRFHASVVAVVLMLILGTITIVLLSQSPPMVSCTAATHCSSPDRSIPDDHLDRRRHRVDE
jgi:hypothetical protein